MPELQRTPIAISIFKPQIIVDSVEGCWFAVVSDGSTQVEVTEWPLWDCQFFVDAHTVLHVTFYVALDEVQFWRSERSKFAEVYIPAAKVMSGHDGVFRNWFGLQKGYFLDEVNFRAAIERYEASLMLAKSLLTPKFCISVLSANASTLERPSLARDGITAERNKGFENNNAMLRQSVIQHSTIITALHQQMRTLWLKGRIVSEDKPMSGGFTAHLIDANIEDTLPFAGAPDYEEYDYASLDETDFASIQALQRETKHLQEMLQEERARSGAAQKDLEVLRSSGVVAVRWGDINADELKQKHADELQQMNRIHAVEVEALRAAEREQRLLVQDLQRKGDGFAQDMLRKNAQVIVLHDEIGELTSRLAEAWNTHAQSPNVYEGEPPVAHNALSFAELESSRREVEQLRRRLLASEGVAVASDNGTPFVTSPDIGCRSHGNAIERALSVVQDFRKDAIYSFSQRELVLYSEVDRLASFAVELRNEREGTRIACEDLCRRRDVAERRAADLQREVDQAAGEAMLTASTMLDKESQELALRQEVRSWSVKFLELQESVASVATEASTSQSGTHHRGDTLVVLETSKTELESKLRNAQEAWLRQQNVSELALAELDSLKGILKSRTLEQNEEVFALKAGIQKERHALKEQAVSHAEVMRQRDAQHVRHLGAVYAELSLETQARQEADKCIAEIQEADVLRSQSGEYAAYVAAGEREDRLRCELQDLEDANMAMSQQTQLQFDDFASLQTRFSNDILTFRKEQAMLEDGPTSITRLQQAHRTLRNEVKELHDELNEERKLRKEVEEARMSRSPVSALSSASTNGGTPSRRPVEGVWGVEPVVSVAATMPPHIWHQRTASPHIAVGHNLSTLGAKPHVVIGERHGGR